MVVIFNPAAGATDNNSIRSKLAQLIQDAGRTADIVNIESGHDIAATIQRALKQSDGAIIAAGGDGTVSAVASQLAGTARPLGVLPLGTLNHFAKDLGIPLDLEAAVRTLITGRTMFVDVGEVNGCVFINNSSLGLYPHIVIHREAQEERLGKWPAFVWAGVRAFRRFPFLRLRVCLEGRQLTRKTAFLFIGNNQYEMIGFRIGARPRLNGGTLGLYLTHGAGRFGLLALALRAFVGHLKQAKDFESFSVEEAVIESRRVRLLVAIDGEVQWMNAPLHYRSRPLALGVIVPQ